jgi:hypothetical protein
MALRARKPYCLALNTLPQLADPAAVQGISSPSSHQAQPSPAQPSPAQTQPVLCMP